MLRAASAFERIGDRWGQTFAGVLVVEAGKQIYAVTPEAAHRRARRRVRPLAVPGGAATYGRR
jgi:hypothetical protein